MTVGRIPVIVLSGFLGSGKTTLLLRLLQYAKANGKKSSVLMNELGSLDVDGQIIAKHLSAGDLEKLFDGCICCDKKSEVASSVQKLLKRSTDILFIELTGVANPEEIADALTEPEILDRVYLHKVLTVLDAEYVLEYNSIFESDRQLVHTLRQQMALADFIIVNKSDLVSEKHKEKIGKAVRKQNDTAPIEYTTYSEVEMDPLFTGIDGRRPRKQTLAPLFVVLSPSCSHQEDKASYSRVQTVSFSAQKPLRERDVEKFLKRWSSELLRAKGYLSIDGKGHQLMQFSGKRTNWQLNKEVQEVYIVLIGMNLDVEKLKEDWESLS
ncbi:GTP-binding protein [Ammoniphilus sp. YIM 78166]|uniref:CobW family GTP-binding protein n=1 Tax=Ammoniphilus sp. YIM 78166 TaxID=1644106 RepID=UPI00106FF640|nr:GTP-binding protein [Ammoniphilus sp. YIM 78166]